MSVAGGPDDGETPAEQLWKNASVPRHEERGRPRYQRGLKASQPFGDTPQNDVGIGIHHERIAVAHALLVR